MRREKVLMLNKGSAIQKPGSRMTEIYSNGDNKGKSAPLMSKLASVKLFFDRITCSKKLSNDDRSDEQASVMRPILATGGTRDKPNMFGICSHSGVAFAIYIARGFTPDSFACKATKML